VGSPPTPQAFRPGLESPQKQPKQQEFPIHYHPPLPASFNGCESNELSDTILGNFLFPPPAATNPPIPSKNHNISK